MYKLLTIPLKILRDVAVFFKEFIKDDDGRSGLYLTVLLIPSICLGILLIIEYDVNKELRTSNTKLTIELRNYEKSLPVLKDSLRRQVMNEYVDLVKSMNDLNNLIKDDNTYRSRQIKNKTSDVNNQLKNVEYENR